MTHFKFVFVLILIGLLVVFVLQNYEVVELRFLIWTLAMSRALMLFFVFAIGLILGWLLRGLTRQKERIMQDVPV